jgi:hypothetical protein
VLLLVGLMITSPLLTVYAQSGNGDGGGDGGGNGGRNGGGDGGEVDKEDVQDGATMTVDKAEEQDDPPLMESHLLILLYLRSLSIQYLQIQIEIQCLQIQMEIQCFHNYMKKIQNPFRI